ncbi:MAG: spore maturation protein [Anaeroplasma sp.]
MKQGITILPYLLIMYVAVRAIKASMLLEDVMHLKYVPNELLIQGIFRPISSHASLSMMLSSIAKYGVDSKEGLISAILQGGSDTTIYVMGLYFGFVGIKKTKHSYIVGLLCDLICLLLCLYIFFVLL